MDPALRILFALSLLALCGGLRAADDNNALTQEEKAAGWILLFDGRTSKGWLEVTGRPFPIESWRVEDGALRALDSGHGYQDLRTKDTFVAFEFQFDWKIQPGGNSGVKYMVQKTDRWTNAKGLQARARGFEYQLVDNALPDAAEKKKACGSLYGFIAPSQNAANPPGEYNHSLLIVRGDHVEHWLNGVKVVDFQASQFDQPPVPESFLALQNHGTPVWFRSLKIRRLTRYEY